MAYAVIACVGSRFQPCLCRRQSTRGGKAAATDSKGATGT